MLLNITWHHIVIRLALASIASFLIGLDRDEHGKAAGMRTTMLVCLAATLAMIEANLLITTSGKGPASFVQLDVMRLPLGILSGIGFLGGGAIVRRGAFVQGLTTAATLWLVTVLGLLFGAGLLGLGVGASIITLIILWLLKRLENHIPSVRNATMTLEFSPHAPHPGLTEQALRDTLQKSGFHITTWNARFLDSRLRTVECGLRWSRTGHRQPSTPEVIEQLAATVGISRLNWKA